jgi:hypothetical protein
MQSIACKPIDDTALTVDPSRRSTGAVVGCGRSIASSKRDLRARGLRAARRCSFDCLGASPSAHSKGLPPKTTDEIAL